MPPATGALEARNSAPHGTARERLQAAIAIIATAKRSGAGDDTVLAAAAAAATSAMGTDATMLWAPCRTTGALEVVASSIALPAETLLALSAAAESSLEVLHALRANQTYLAHGAALTAIPMGSELAAATGAGALVAIPLTRGDEFLGALTGIAYESQCLPTGDSVEIGLALAEHVSAALLASRGDDEVAAQLRVQNALHQISTAMVSGRSVDAVLQQIAESSLVALRADRIAVWRYNAGQETFVLGAEAGRVGGQATPRVLQAQGTGARSTHCVTSAPRCFASPRRARHPLVSSAGSSASLASTRSPSGRSCAETSH